MILPLEIEGKWISFEIEDFGEKSAMGPEKRWNVAIGLPRTPGVKGRARRHPTKLAALEAIREELDELIQDVDWEIREEEKS